MGLASITSDSMSIPLAMDETVGTHNCSDGVPSGSPVVSSLVAPPGDGSEVAADVLSTSVVGSGCFSSQRGGDWLDTVLGGGELASSSVRPMVKADLQELSTHST